MAVWAIADLHLSFGVPDKKMDPFGPVWVDHAEKIKRHWEEKVSPDDLVLLAGDISWAINLEQAQRDLDWIAALPGTKIMLRGNHDYWWSSLKKMKKIMPPSIIPVHNNAVEWGDISIGGTRLWDSQEYGFSEFIQYTGERPAAPKEKDLENQERIFQRELQRLELSLKALDPSASKRVVMTHYPPISASLAPSQTSVLLEKYQVDLCVFGHLHNVRKDALPFGEKNSVSYLLTACDYLDFSPLEITF